MAGIHAHNSPCISPEYVLDRLDELGPRLLQSIEASQNLLHDSLQNINTTYEIDFPPSHILAIQARSKDGGPSFFLQPVHDIILHSKCSRFPPIPPEYRLSFESPTFTAAPIIIPHPPSFDILYRYLYTQNVDDIIRYLLAYSCRSSKQRRNASGMLSHHVEALILAGNGKTPGTYRKTIADLQNALTSSSVTHQRRSISHLKGVLANCRALGICEPRLYAALRLVSSILHNALRLEAHKLRQRH